MLSIIIVIQKGGVPMQDTVLLISKAYQDALCEILSPHYQILSASTPAQAVSLAGQAPSPVCAVLADAALLP